MDCLGWLDEFDVAKDMIYFILRKLKAGVISFDACFVQSITGTGMTVVI